MDGAQSGEDGRPLPGMKETSWVHGCGVGLDYWRLEAFCAAWFLPLALWPRATFGLLFPVVLQRRSFLSTSLLLSSAGTCRHGKSTLTSCKLFLSSTSFHDPYHYEVKLRHAH